MLGPQRRFLLCLTVLAALCVAVQGVTGIPQLALFLTPVFLIAALLLSGRFVAEERIVARWRATASARRPRRRAVRWRARAVRVLHSRLLHGSLGVRGPPAPLAPAA